MGERDKRKKKLLKGESMGSKNKENQISMPDGF